MDVLLFINCLFNYLSTWIINDPHKEIIVINFRIAIKISITAKQQFNWLYAIVILNFPINFKDLVSFLDYAFNDDDDAIYYMELHLTANMVYFIISLVIRNQLMSMQLNLLFYSNYCLRY